MGRKSESGERGYVAGVCTPLPHASLAKKVIIGARKINSWGRYQSVGLFGNPGRWAQRREKIHSNTRIKKQIQDTQHYFSFMLLDLQYRPLV